MTAGCEVSGCPFFAECLGRTQLKSDLRSMKAGSTIKMNKEQANMTADAYKAAGCVEPGTLDSIVSEFPEEV